MPTLGPPATPIKQSGKDKDGKDKDNKRLARCGKCVNCKSQVCVPLADMLHVALPRHLVVVQSSVVQLPAFVPLFFLPPRRLLPRLPSRAGSASGPGCEDAAR